MTWTQEGVPQGILDGRRSARRFYGEEPIPRNKPEEPEVEVKDDLADDLFPEATQ